MSHPKIKRALISVYDKTGVVEFARALHSEFGIGILSTGGTAGLLEENDVPVTLVEEVTGFPEMMDGRVKTLHPKIHAAILADRDNPEHMRQLEEQGIQPIDMVVVNLYPFENTAADPTCTLERAIEMIDIGGPCMLRAAAKNHKHVLPVYDPGAYAEVLGALRGRFDPDDIFLRYAGGVFEATSCYDGEVARWLSEREEGSHRPSFFPLSAFNWGPLRYGENPHQAAQLLQPVDEAKSESGSLDLVPSDVLSEYDEQVRMSFNNYADADAAARLCNDLTRELGLCDAGLQRAGVTGATHEPPLRPFCVFVKHTNACGTGVADDPIEAYRRAYIGDPNAAMGGILACSFEVGVDFAEAVMNTYARWGKDAGAGGFFIEVWIAPGFSEEAVKVIRASKKWGERVRLFGVGSMSVAVSKDEVEYKTISGGVLRQTRDNVGLNEDQWKVATKRQPTDQELSDLRLAWLVAKHTKSNAITVCKDGMLIGNGAGQMSRVMSCRIATWLAKENGHEAKLTGAVAASDAFFPFSDGPAILMDAGVTAIIQPGGSKRDEDTIEACDKRDVAMIFTGMRHFKH